MEGQEEQLWSKKKMAGEKEQWRNKDMGHQNYKILNDESKS